MSAQKRPNLLMIHTDQQATWTVGAHGATEIKTPNLDRIAKEGAAVHGCHTVSAVCTPSRGCLMTGQYPHQHGAHTNNLPLDNNAVTWAMQYRDAGYRTAYIGKWHLDGDLRPGFVHAQRGFGFDDTTYMFNRGHWKRLFDRQNMEPGVSPDIAEQAEEFTTDYLVDKTIAFIEQDSEQPFCTMLSIPDPHAPFSVREPYASMFKPDDMEVPASLDDTNRPNWISAKHYSCGFQTPESVERLKRQKAKYLGMVACIDDNVGRLLQCLENNGQLDNTIIVFTSDHGEYLGEHGLMGKNSLYRSAYEIPCLIRYPEKIPAGTELNQLCTHNDLVPTICALGNIDAPPVQSGRDMSALLAGEEHAWTNEVHQHHATYKAAGLITDEWHLFLHQDGEHRLFNQHDDREEMHDRFADEPEIVHAMAKRIFMHHEDTGSPAVAWIRKLECVQNKPSIIYS